MPCCFCHLEITEYAEYSAKIYKIYHIEVWKWWYLWMLINININIIYIFPLGLIKIIYGFIYIMSFFNSLTVNSTEKMNKTHGTAKLQINFVVRSAESNSHNTCFHKSMATSVWLSVQLWISFHRTALKQFLCCGKYRYVLLDTENIFYCSF